MGVQRTVGCPHCGAGRVTKAAGRQRLGCMSCGRSFLVRDAADAPTPPPAAPEPAAVPAPAAVGIGGVEVLPPARLAIGAVTFPDTPIPPPPDETGSGGGPPSPPAGAPSVTVREELEEHPSPDPPPVSAGPGKRLGYYGRVLGGRK